MRTKSILLTAALVAAGAATSMAQVYSLNVVGYINVPIQPGFQMISDPLVNTVGSPNTLASLFGNPPQLTNGVVFEEWTGSGFLSEGVSHGVWQHGGTNTINPGAGCFVSYPAGGAPTTNFVFTGQVLSATSTSGPLTNNVVAGYQIISPLIPVAGDLVTNLQYVPNAGDQVLLWTPPSGPYVTHGFNHGVWGGGVPTNAPGQSFFLNASAASAAEGGWVETNNFTGQ